MRSRLITGVVLALAASAVLLLFSATLLKILMVLLVLLGSYECARLVMPRAAAGAHQFAAVLGAGFSAVLMFKHQHPQWLLFSFPVIIFLVFAYYLRKHESMESAASEIAGTFFTLFYFAFLFSFLGFLRDLPQGWAWLFLLLATTFGADTGAFFAGRYFGKHKLAPKVSPGKTLEGLLGGVVASIVFALFVKLIIYQGFSAKTCVVAGVLAGLIGPIGDLSESLVKRSVGVKDSGNMLPGHGGMLDRVDALLFTAPVIYFYAWRLYF